MGGCWLHLCMFIIKSTDFIHHQIKQQIRLSIYNYYYSFMLLSTKTLIIEL